MKARLLLVACVFGLVACPPPALKIADIPMIPRDAVPVMLPWQSATASPMAAELGAAPIAAELVAAPSFIGALWLEPRSLGSAAAFFAKFDGTTWSAPVVVAENIYVDSSHHPVSLDVLPGGQVRARWLDRSNRSHPTMRVFATDDGVKWRSIGEFAAPENFDEATVRWVDIEENQIGAAWLQATRRFMEQKSKGVVVYAPNASGEMKDVAIASRVAPEGGVSAVRYLGDMIVAYRQHDPVGSATSNQSTIYADLVSGTKRGHILSRHDPWAFGSSDEGIGPVLAATDRGLSAVYFSATREGHPALEVWRLPGGEHSIPTQGKVSDLQAHIDSAGNLVIAALEDGQPTIHVVSPGGDTAFRVGRLPVGGGARLVWSGTLNGRQYLAWDSGALAHLVLTRILDENEAAPLTPVAQATSRCAEAVAALADAERAVRDCVTKGGACEAEFERLKRAARARGECPDQSAGASVAVQKTPEATPTPTPEKWMEASSAHFRVFSPQSEAETRELILATERIRSELVLSGVDPDASEPGLPTTIYATKTTAESEAFGMTGRNRVVISRGELFGPAIHLRVPLDADATADLRHHLHHLYFDRAQPVTPEWLREGLAEVATATSEANGEAIAGSFAQGDLAQATARTISVQAFFDAPPAGRDDHGGIAARPERLFAQYLLFDEKDGAAKLARFLTLLSQGATQRAAAEESWGSLEDLQRRFDAAMSASGGPATRKAPIAPAPANVSVTPMPLARLHALRAEACIESGRLPAANAWLAQALKFDPSDAVAWEVKGRLSLRAGVRSLAHTAFEHSMSRADAPFSSHYFAAVTFNHDSSGYFPERKEADRELSQALVMQPRFAPAISARAALLAERKPEEALKLIGRAIELEPADPRYEIRAARVYRVAGDKIGGKTLAERAARHSLASRDVEVAAQVCIHGTAAGFGDSVSELCDRIVTQAPGDWRAHDARGIARAIRGDRQGAIDDLRLVLDDGGRALPEETRHSRQLWLDAELRNERRLPKQMIEELDDPLW